MVCEGVDVTPQKVHKRNGAVKAARVDDHAAGNPNARQEPPPFALDDVRKKIPAACFERNTLRSIGYFCRDVAVLALLYAAIPLVRAYPLLYPLWLYTTGLFLWALFVVGHDCGHGSFSPSGLVNSVFGHIAHTVLLVPYHAWRLSHRAHHTHHGDLEKDHTFVPPPREIYASMPATSRFIRFTSFPFLGYYQYLTFGMHPHWGTHWFPGAIFPHMQDKVDVSISVAAIVAWLAAVYQWGHLVWGAGVVNAVVWYGLPLSVFGAWIAVVTHLHHTHPRSPWFRAPTWTYLRGALSTVDRSYSPIVDEIHHNIGTHVVHHMFPTAIPHYHLKTATAAVKPMLGDHYQFDPSSAFVALYRNWRYCRCVSDDGTVCLPKQE